ncbi:endolytic transglycosylase MltG [Streptomyces fuscigenes]|uniref:endolytic transglycosylase MltG n=1 Tax=Streptomyces fuscigenes TaxID=1528880 RepID=UPI001F340CA5|nr:endolytic transglycosylase MltG [Streptomyces fuscigenes]MCF3962895.1 endolytic transglycosylase MltG [Streptomyces fuscigenes]
MTNRSYRPDGRPGRRRGPGRAARPRLTRRGRLALFVTSLLVLGAAVLVPVLLLSGGGEQGGGPRATLVVPEGRRASEVYASIDKVLAVPPGTTRRAAASAHLELAGPAHGNPEGYLFPATYPVDAHATPASLLAFMVDTANRKLGTDHVRAGAAHHGMTVYQALTVASIVQAEAATPHDMGRVARVVLNRLAKGMPLQMDSTLNYALHRTTLDTTDNDTKVRSPYNTYAHKGLPPTPIGNPGETALKAVGAPPPGKWLYFVTVKDGDTRFATSYAQQQENVKEFNANRRG